MGCAGFDSPLIAFAEYNMILGMALWAARDLRALTHVLPHVQGQYMLPPPYTMGPPVMHQGMGCSLMGMRPHVHPGVPHYGHPGQQAPPMDMQHGIPSALAGGPGSQRVLVQHSGAQLSHSQMQSSSTMEGQQQQMEMHLQQQQQQQLHQQNQLLHQQQQQQQQMHVGGAPPGALPPGMLPGLQYGQMLPQAPVQGGLQQSQGLLQQPQGGLQQLQMNPQERSGSLKSAHSTERCAPPVHRILFCLPLR